MKSVTVIYFHIPNEPHHAALADLYVESVLENRGGYEHRNLIVSQGALPTAEMQSLFNRLPGCSFFVTEAGATTVGGFIAAAATLQDHVVVCLASSARVRKSGWLARMMQVWDKHGPGLYGSLSSNQVRPHLCATGFWCAPQMLLRYPRPVVSREDRDEFEHGPGSFWTQLREAGEKVMLATWDEEYGWGEWRNPPNISCRGSQANCLTYSQLNYDYEHCCQHDDQGRLNLERLTDTATIKGNANEPSVTMVYIHVVGDPGHVAQARAFVASYLANPPQVRHQTMVVCNGKPPTATTLALFSKLPNIRYLNHDDSGWDIGGYIAASRQINTDIMLCLGGSAYVKRAGWMRRMVDAWQKHGPGLYGSLASYEVTPHLNTTGFWCSPDMLSHYPYAVTTKNDRYEFEHGRTPPSPGMPVPKPRPERVFWRTIYDAGWPVKLVTWDGEYDWWDWRKPSNIFRRGDQTNCLTFWHNCEVFDKLLSDPQKAHFARMTDTLIDTECDISHRSWKPGKQYYERLRTVPRNWEQPGWVEHFRTLAARLMESCEPRRALHIGCAEGFLVDALRNRDVDAWGVDASATTISQVPERVRPYCRVAASAASIEGDYDLIVCTELAKALPETEAMLAEICRHTSQIILSPAANKGRDAAKSDLDPTGDWVELLQRQGFFPDHHFEAAFTGPLAMRFLRGTNQTLDVSVFEPHPRANGQSGVANITPDSDRQSWLRLRWRSAGNPQADFEELLKGDVFVLGRESCDLQILSHLTAAAREIGHPIVLEFCDLPVRPAETNPFPKDKPQISPEESAILHAVDFVTVPTDALKRYLEDYEGLPKARVHVLPDGFKSEQCEALFRSFQISGRRPEPVTAPAALTGHDRAALYMMLYRADVCFGKGQIQQSSVLCNQAVDRYSLNDPAAGRFVRATLTRYRDIIAQLQLNSELATARAVADVGAKDKAIDLYLAALDSVQKGDNHTLILCGIVEVVRAFLTLDSRRGRILLDLGYQLARGMGSKAGLQKLDQLTAEYQRRPAPSKGPEPKAKNLQPTKATVTEPSAPPIPASEGSMAGEAPAVSIILPAYDNVALTRGCLDSLARTPTTVSYEIIVVNNGSSDGTADFLREWEKTHNIRVITFQRNVGFARATNRGSQAARGQYFLLLNNDTVVTPGWLEALVQTVRRPQTGLVGARLLYADGRIQHAGVDFINGIPDHPYRYAPANAPEANQFRELDMVSGACVLIQGELYRQLAGFDETYRQGAEDIDLCLRVRAAGWKVVYEPKAVIYHLEGQSAGRFDHVNENLRFFFSRWSKSFDKTQRFVPPQPPRIIAPLASLLLEESAPQHASRSISIAWEGTFLDFGSLSHVNRELTHQLARQPGVALTRVGNPALTNGYAAAPELRALVRELAPQAPRNTQVTIRHAWPPNWSPRNQGALVVIQPWEYGSLPADWVAQAQHVQQFWVPSEHVRQVYVQSGVPAAKVKVVPNGIDPERFRPGAPKMTLPTRKSFKFLFVGGTIHRKGPDVLLNAYLKAFTVQDDVCLVIKDFGGKSFYNGQTFEQSIQDAQRQPNAPEILYLTEELAAEALSGLYAACDCLVHPYRGEGFGLPVLEAMACGLPVIVTVGGAADDFATTGLAYHIAAQRRSIGRAVGGMSLVGEGWLLEPSVEETAARMRHVFGHREEARAKGLAASQAVRREWTWERAAALAHQHLQTLVADTGTAAAIISPSPTCAKAAPIVLPPCAFTGHLAQSRTQLGNKKYQTAWELTLAAIRARPYHPEAYLLLAGIALAAGNAASARHCAQHARDLAPTWKPVKRFLKSNLRGNFKHDWMALPEALAASHAPRLSVCLIVKNEEKFLAQCLTSVRGLADQIIIVDTGSADRTVAIAKEHGAEVYAFAWCDDFSAARNAALEHATGDWILMLDADEELPSESHGALRKLLANPAVMAWRLPIIDVGREAEGCCYVPRLFRNAPALFYVGRVHEQVFTSIEVRRQEWGLDSRLGDAALRHHGYLPEVLKDRNKIERNLHLLEKAIVELPDEPSLLMNYGLELVRSGQLETGMEQYRKAFDLMSAQAPSLIISETREMLLTQFCTQLIAQRRFDEIIRVLTAPLAQSDGMTASLHFALGLAHLELKQPREAADQMRQCLAKRDQPSLAPINTEIRKAGPHHCLAMCLTHLGEANAAADEFRLAIKDDPQSRPARFDYARFLTTRGEMVEALNLLFELSNQNGDDLKVWLLGGQIALSRPEFLEVALDWTTEAQKHFPEDPAILRQRAEVLMLVNRCAEAVPLWRQLRPETDPVLAAALVLCETVADDNQFSPPTHLETQISREFLKWYQRLIQFNGRPTVEAINVRIDSLQSRLPSVTHLLQAAIAQASVAAAP